MTIFVFWQELMAVRHISGDKPFNYKENTFDRSLKLYVY